MLGYQQPAPSRPQPLADTRHGAEPLSVRRPTSSESPTPSASGEAGAADAAPAAVREAWSLLLALRDARLDGTARGYAIGADGHAAEVSADDGRCMVVRDDGNWRPADALAPAARALLDLYLPVCRASAGRPFTVAHLGQSLDGYIATDSGDSYYVTGPDNVLHLHRMRALCGAVVVGAETISMDDPRLTVRLASGPNPLRVVLDPRRRLAAHYRVFADGEAPTLLISAEDRVEQEGARHGRAEVVGIPAPAGRLALDVLLDVLRRRGVHSVFVEGGGATVSHFLQADLLDRLQIAVAPLVTGHGRPGIRLVARHHLSECLRPAHRVFRMGADILFDCDLRGTADEPAKPGDAAGLTRVL
ncbi:MAG TPA: RibD family protein [Gammaproteobacteria bacterium]